MALITFAGFPAAGKSTRASQLRDFLLEKIRCSEYSGPIQKVLVLSDHSLGLSRNVYDGISLLQRLPNYRQQYVQTVPQRSLPEELSLLICSASWPLIPFSSSTR